MASAGGITTLDIESAMQELVKLVVTKSAGDLDSQIKQNFFIIARSFYYSAYCNIGTINFHISKVLFERVQWSCTCKSIKFATILYLIDCDHKSSNMDLISWNVDYFVKIKDIKQNQMKIVFIQIKQ